MRVPDNTVLTVKVAASMTILIGATGLMGWISDIDWMRSVVPRAIEMTASTAVGLLLSGVALWMLRPSVAGIMHGLIHVSGMTVMLLGLATSAQYFFGWSLGIDELLLSDTTTQAYDAAPGRMSPYGAFTFTAIGVFLVMGTRPGLQWLKAMLAMVAVAVGSLSGLGYVWEARESTSDDGLPPVALHTALAFVLFGVGALLSLRKSTDAQRSVPSPIEQRLIGSFLIAVVLLVIGGGLTYRASANSVDIAESLIRAQELRAELWRFDAWVLHAEIEITQGTRTAASAEARQYISELPRRAQALRELASDHEERQLVNRLHLMATDHLQSLANGIRRSTVQVENESIDDSIEQQANHTRAHIQQLMLSLDERQAKLLMQREAQSRVSHRNALAFSLITLPWAAAIFGFLLHSIRKETRSRELVQKKIQALNAELELRVQERTAALRESERHFADLFEFAPDAFIIANSTGAIVRINRAAEALFGWTRKELLGHPVEVLMPEQTASSHMTLRESYLSEGISRPMAAGRPDLRARRKSGETFHVAISLSPLQNGQERWVLATVRDTTERAQLNEALQRAATLYRDTLDNMLEACQVLGFDWRYQYINDAAAAQNRLAKETMLGRTMMEVFPGIDTLEVFKHIRRCMEERTTQYNETDFVFPDGRVAWFQITVLAIPEGIAIFSVDITENKKAQQAMLALNAELEQRVEQRTRELVQAREAADAANRAKSVFLAAMSHEIRTPMNGVVGMVDVLAHSGLNGMQLDAVQTIRTLALSLLGIIDDILDFSKIEAGRLELERTSVALHELVEGVCETLLPGATRKHVDLRLFIHPRVSRRVWSDATRLRQILFNLVGNALKFSVGSESHRGLVRVRVEPSGTPHPGLLIQVVDNGIGMSAKTLSQIFTSFSQAEASTTRRFGGTGLGLAICKRLVDLMNGDIQVVSELDKGASFTVRLPIEPDRLESGEHHGPDLRGQSCLLVDTEPDAHDLRIYLESAGAQVQLMTSMEEAALAALKRGDRPIVIQRTWRELPQAQWLQTLFAPHLGVRHLVLVHGPRPWSFEPQAQVLALPGAGLKRLTLLQAVAVLAGREAGELQAQPGLESKRIPVERATTVSQAHAQGQLILVAEDDEVNQKVILRQVEVLGYAAEIAGDGREALSMWREGRYALVLTDLHMPEMDGYALAEAIRREEPLPHGVRRGHTPILALTANALHGEALRAQASGMNGYMTKPLQLSDLQDALNKWLPPPGMDNGADGTQWAIPAQSQPSPVFDRQVLDRVLGAGDEDGLSHLLAHYVDKVEQSLLELRAAYEQDNLLQIATIAHQLKSSSRSVGAMGLADCCAELENASKVGMGERVKPLIVQFEAQWPPCKRQITEYLRGLSR